MTDNGMQNRRALAKQTDINIVEQLARAFVSFVVLLQINRTNMAEAVKKKKKKSGPSDYTASQEENEASDGDEDQNGKKKTKKTKVLSSSLLSSLLSPPQPPEHSCLHGWAVFTDRL